MGLTESAEASTDFMVAAFGFCFVAILRATPAMCSIVEILRATPEMSRVALQ